MNMMIAKKRAKAKRKAEVVNNLVRCAQVLACFVAIYAITVIADSEMNFLTNPTFANFIILVVTLGLGVGSALGISKAVGDI